MDKLDGLIAQGLENGDKQILERTRELGYFQQALGLFSGRNGWINWIIILLQALMFFVAIWSGWHFFQATEMLSALKWGLSSATLLLMAGTLKFTLTPVMQANRIIRELKRVELMLVRKGD